MDIIQDNRGFSLIEVLMALVVFSIGILAVASMQLSSITGNDRANTGSIATALASGKMDELLTMAYDRPTTLPAAVNYPLDDIDGNGAAGLLDEDAAADHVETPLGLIGNYQVFWNVADDLPAPEMKRINVIVRWTAADSRQHRVVLNSIKNRGR